MCSSTMCYIGHNLRGSRVCSGHDLDVTFTMDQLKSNINMPIESPLTTFYMMVMVDGNVKGCPICHHLRDIRNQNVLDLDLQNGPRSNINILIKSRNIDSYLMTISMSVRSFTIYEIIANQVKYQKFVLENAGQGHEEEQRHMRRSIGNLRYFAVDCFLRILASLQNTLTTKCNIHTYTQRETRMTTIG